MSDLSNPKIEGKLFDSANKATDIAISLEDMKQASDTGMTLVNYINDKYENSANPALGTPFEQVLAKHNVKLHRDPKTGAGAHSIAKLLSPQTGLSITRPDGSQALTVSGRMLVNSVIEQMAYSELFVNTSTFENDFNGMVAQTVTTESSIVFQPLVNATAPYGSRMQSVAAGAEPVSMVRISLSDRSFRIPSVGIGLEIDDEAARNQTIDEVGIIVQEQARGQKIHNIRTAINNMYAGDFDLGLTALTTDQPAVAASVFDSTAVSAATFSNKAFCKWLMRDADVFTITHVMCDEDAWWTVMNATIMANYHANGTPLGLYTQPIFMNPMLPNSVKFLVVRNGAIPAGTLIGLDRSRAMKKYVWAGGNYAASEEYVMRRTRAMRFDIAEMYTRMLPKSQGWKVLTFA